MRRLFVNEPITLQKDLPLSEDRSHYVSRVLRSQTGDQFEIFNGDGSAYIAEITELKKRQVTLKVLKQSCEFQQPTLHMHLGISLSKGDRMDTIMQKCTELGVNEITPLISEHIAFKLKPQQLEKKHDHWQKIIVSACEQSQQNHLPILHKTCALQDWAKTTDSDLALFLHPYSDKTLHNFSQQKVSRLSLLVGPEGGLSEMDTQQAEKENFTGVTLGPRILRTETAPIAVAAIAQYMWGDF